MGVLLWLLLYRFHSTAATLYDYQRIMEWRTAPFNATAWTEHRAATIAESIWSDTTLDGCSWTGTAAMLRFLELYGPLMRPDGGLASSGDVCPLSTPDRFAAMRERKAYDRPGVWRCTSCEKKFRTEYHLDTHLLRRHRNLVAHDRLCLAALCPALGVNSSALQYDMLASTRPLALSISARQRERLLAIEPAGPGCTAAAAQRWRTVCETVVAQCASEPRAALMQQHLCSRLSCETAPAHHWSGLLSALPPVPWPAWLATAARGTAWVLAGVVLVAVAAAVRRWLRVARRRRLRQLPLSKHH